MKTTDTPFGRIIVSEDVPKGTILLLPPITITHYLNYQTVEVKCYLKHDPAAAGIITNIGKL